MLSGNTSKTGEGGEGSEESYLFLLTAAFGTLESD